MNVCTKYHDYPSSSCWDSSVWRKWWQHCHSLHENSLNENKRSTDIPSLICSLCPSVITQSSICPLPLPRLSSMAEPQDRGWACPLLWRATVILWQWFLSGLPDTDTEVCNLVQPTGVRSVAPDLTRFVWRTTTQNCPLWPCEHHVCYTCARMHTAQ